MADSPLAGRPGRPRAHLFPVQFCHLNEGKREAHHRFHRRFTASLATSSTLFFWSFFGGDVHSKPEQHWRGNNYLATVDANAEPQSPEKLLWRYLSIYLKMFTFDGYYGHWVRTVFEETITFYINCISPNRNYINLHLMCRIGASDVALKWVVSCTVLGCVLKSNLSLKFCPYPVIYWPFLLILCDKLKK